MNDVHTARIDAKGLSPEGVRTVQLHAEAIAHATDAEIDCLSTLEDSDD